MITLEHVYIEYTKTKIALRDINIHVDKGEFVFIVGPSGAGKSTFIKMLTHELVPYKGSVIVNGVEVNKLKKAKFHTIGESSASFFRISAFCRKRRCLKILPLFFGSLV